MVGVGAVSGTPGDGGGTRVCVRGATVDSTWKARQAGSKRRNGAVAGGAAALVSVGRERVRTVSLRQADGGEAWRAERSVRRACGCRRRA